MKNFITRMKIIAATIDTIAEWLSAIICVAISIVFSKLKWSWAGRMESKFAWHALEYANACAIVGEKIIVLGEELGRDMSALRFRTEEQKEKLIELYDEGKRIYGWR